MSRSKSRKYSYAFPLIKRFLGRPGRSRFVGLAALFFSCAAGLANAGPDYAHGHIIDVTFLNESVMLKLDSDVPENCAGTAYGWLKIPTANKAMAAFVMALWLQESLSSKPVTIYSDGLADGFCRVTQIDPS